MKKVELDIDSLNSSDTYTIQLEAKASMVNQDSVEHGMIYAAISNLSLTPGKCQKTIATGKSLLQF